MKAKFEFIDIPAGLPGNSMVIKDLLVPGEPTVLQDARAVVETLLRIAARMSDPVGYNMPPIYYHNPAGGLTQLEHDGVDLIEKAD